MSEDTTGTELVPSAGENALKLRPPRLPYHPAIEERFGIDRGTWKYLTDVQFPNAEEPESIITALSYCRARKLDIMKKPVNIVSVWDKKRGRMVDSVWPAITESRITAMRTGEYAGKDPTEFGPDLTETLGGVEVTYPEWAQVTVYRFIKGIRCPFAGERILWKEYYAPAKKDTAAPNDMWKRKSHSQASKCAEASALRCAFPEELGASPTDVEMEGQEVEGVALERVTPGLMQRLTGKQDGDGFHNGRVQAETAPKKPRKKKGAVDPESPPEAEPEEQMHAAADPELSVEAAEEAKSEIRQPEPEKSTEPENVNHAAPGEIYLLDGDKVNAEGRQLTYRDGVRHSSVMNPELTDLKTYPVHSPEKPSPIGDDDIPEHMRDENAPRSVEEARAEALSELAENDAAEVADADISGLPEPGYPPEFQAFIDNVEGAKTWADVKAAMTDFWKSPTFKGFDVAQQNTIRANTWETAVDNGVEGLPDHADDLTAFRIWIEAQDDPDAIRGTKAALERSDQWARASDGMRTAFNEVVEARCKVLSNG